MSKARRFEVLDVGSALPAAHLKYQHRFDVGEDALHISYHISYHMSYHISYHIGTSDYPQKYVNDSCGPECSEGHRNQGLQVLQGPWSKLPALRGLSGLPGDLSVEKNPALPWIYVIPIFFYPIVILFCF